MSGEAHAVRATVVHEGHQSDGVDGEHDRGGGCTLVFLKHGQYSDACMGGRSVLSKGCESKRGGALQYRVEYVRGDLDDVCGRVGVSGGAG